MHQIIPIPALKDNYIWLLINNQNKHCIVVDPGEAHPAMAKLQSLQLTLSAILITHHHADHCHGVAELLHFKNVPVYSSDPARIPTTTQCIHEKSFFIDALELTFEVLSIPGHTKTHCAFYSPGFVFTGDTLFTGGCGRLFEGTASDMIASLNKLQALPQDTLIYCGHEYTEKNLEFAKYLLPENLAIQKRWQNTLENTAKHSFSVPAPLSLEKSTNPFLRCNTDEVREAAEKIAKRRLHTEKEVFAVIRQAKDVF